MLPRCRRVGSVLLLSRLDESERDEKFDDDDDDVYTSHLSNDQHPPFFQLLRFSSPEADESDCFAINAVDSVALGVGSSRTVPLSLPSSEWSGVANSL